MSQPSTTGMWAYMAQVHGYPKCDPMWPVTHTHDPYPWPVWVSQTHAFHYGYLIPWVHSQQRLLMNLEHPIQSGGVGVTGVQIALVELGQLRRSYQGHIWPYTFNITHSWGTLDECNGTCRYDPDVHERGLTFPKLCLRYHVLTCNIYYIFTTVLYLYIPVRRYIIHKPAILANCHHRCIYTGLTSVISQQWPSVSTKMEAHTLREDKAYISCSSSKVGTGI